ncbi:MAG: AAA family ATPase [Rickettsiaceae bacterium]|nr:AAA family ATPase [Rickettsiaceae bacterium]
MNKVFINKINLINFRNFGFKEVVFNEHRILITGPNGSGKTSILEAISLLSPGRGLRGEKQENFILSNQNYSEVTYQINSYLGNVEIKDRIESNSAAKHIYMNDKKIRSSELLKFVNIFWLTPQQNITFQESSSYRRKFFDRIVYSFFHFHATEINSYEHLQKSRLQALISNEADNKWLDIIETQMSKLAQNICLRRWEILNKLNEIISNITSITKVSLKLNSEIDNLAEKQRLDDFYLNIIELFRKNRELDKKSHKTNFGPMKTDFRAHHIDKNMDISLCSTGEQQSCLISILIGHTQLFNNYTDKMPILLLDELFVHLDEKNKHILSNFISNKNMQIFVTSTEKELCSDFFKHSVEIIL